MPLLPRSQRNIWRLALAIWLAACAGLWWVLPPAPRRIIPHTGGLPMFSGDGSRVYLRPTTDVIDVHDVWTGKHLRTWNLGGEPVLYQPGLDFVIAGGEDRETFRIFDLHSGRVGPAPWWTSRVRTTSFASGDGRYLVIEIESAQGTNVIWWDRIDGRTVAELPQATPLVVTANGTWIMADEDSSDLLLRKPASMELIARIPRASKRTAVALAIDGTTIIVFGLPTSIVDANTGAILCQLPNHRGMALFTEENRAASLSFANNRLELKFWNIPSGTDAGEVVIDCTESQSLRQVSLGWARNGIIAVHLRPSNPRMLSPFEKWLSTLPVISRIVDADFERSHFYDVRTGNEIGRLKFSNPRSMTYGLAPDGKTVTMYEFGKPYVEVWDMPPRKSMTHFAVGAALLALPIAFVAWRRAKRYAGNRV